MCRERIVLMVAGTLVLTGLLLAHYVAPGWMFLSAFVGFNMLQSSFTGFCPLGKILKAAGIQPCSEKAAVL
ncbi:MAG: DUF2892 domain-containing protein [bacterium]|nr:DUF2892 domain-containing protein [bacterium]